MTLDRSWVRRPLVSPAPFGRSVPAVWAETQVAIIRRTDAPNAVGGFDGGAEVTIATVMAHVEIQTESGLHIDLTSGPVRRRYYTVIIDPILDHVAQFAPGVYPRKGDVIRFLDPNGTLVETPVQSADQPEGIADHYELESVRFE